MPSIEEASLPYYTEIGRLCREWAGLELTVQSLFISVTKIPDKGGEFLPVISCLDFRQQLAAIKVAAVTTELDHQLTERLIDSVNYIDNVLRPRRNRYVHDWWYLGSNNEAYRVQYNPKLVRPQARQPYRLVPNEITHEPLAQIQDTIADIRDEAENIVGFTIAIDHPDMEESLEELPPRRFLPRRAEKLCPADRRLQAPTLPLE